MLSSPSIGFSGGEEREPETGQLKFVLVDAFGYFQTQKSKKSPVLSEFLSFSKNLGMSDVKDVIRTWSATRDEAFSSGRVLSLDLLRNLFK